MEVNKGPVNLTWKFTYPDEGKPVVLLSSVLMDGILNYVKEDLGLKSGVVRVIIRMFPGVGPFQILLSLLQTSGDKIRYISSTVTLKIGKVMFLTFPTY